MAWSQLGSISVVAYLCFFAGVDVHSAEREIQWSGRTWIVKSADTQGPGPNTWSASTKSVWVDVKKRLHLRIAFDEIRKRWCCAEIRSKEVCGYGRYSCTIESDLLPMDPQMVFGFFAYADDQHEVDMEYSAWSKDEVAQEQFVVQPADRAGHLWKQSYSGAGTTYQLKWFPQGISAHAANSQTQSPWIFKGTVPAADKAHMHINLWLFKGRNPEKEFEVVISKASFIP